MQGIGFLLMALSAVAFVAVLGVVIYAIRTNRVALARHVGFFALGWTALYFVVLVGTSLTSEQRVLDGNDRKAFCGFYLDCHLGVTVEDVQQTTVVGDGAGRVVADGVFYLVTVRVDSDARRATLPLVRPEAVLYDTAGHRYERSPAAEQAVAGQKGIPVTFAQTVPAGTSYRKTLVFDVPDGAPSLRLLITKGNTLERLVERFLIGDEDSLFHRRTVFSI